MKIKIQDLNFNGDGYGFENNKKVIISKTAKNDIVEYDIIKQNKEQIHGKINKIIEKSEYRIKEICCPIYNNCGGCNLLHLTNEAYINFKKSLIINAIKNSGYIFDDYELILTGFNSRRRVTFNVKNNKLGFFEKNSNNLVEVKNCPLIDNNINNIISKLNDLIKKILIKEISVTCYDNGIGILFVLEKEPTMYENEILQNFIKNNDSIISISYKIKNNKQTLLFQKYAPIIKFDNNITINVETDIFLQATKKGQEEITNTVVNHLKDCKNVLDLYCGIGTYSFPLSTYTKVHSIEGSEYMINILNKNIKDNHLSSKITTECRNLVNSPLLKDELNKYDGIVINPPRNGALAQCKQIVKSNIKKIVMVSCNPQTFSIDARELKNYNYKLIKITGIDQFFKTQHLEIVASFIK